MERFHVSCHVGIFSDNGENRFDLFADTQRMKFDFKDVV